MFGAAIREESNVLELWKPSLDLLENTFGSLVKKIHIIFCSAEDVDVHVTQLPFFHPIQ